MKKITLTLFIATFFSLSIFAQTSVWKVEGKGTTLYLGGTLHILRSQDYPLPAEYEKAYLDSQCLVFEADIKEMENPANAQKMMMKAMYTDGRNLKSVLSDETFEALKTEFEKIGMPIERIMQFKPSMALLMLTIAKYQQMGVTSQGIDKFYYSKAEKDEKALKFLETIDAQIELLVGLGEGEEDEFVNYSLKDLEKMKEEFERMNADWKNGTSTYLDEQIKEFIKDYPDIYKALLSDRNNNWLPQIEEMLESEAKEFILVGLMHMYGETGLIDQLQAKGYSVEQL